ncbi:hypothetical protein [Streptomyces sp. NPDC058398]|uniref:hypothetical protein n=1 Tax=Streptomyces sp. NPDC058398 TaxID=3346479 RepID=UPI0036597910
MKHGCLHAGVKVKYTKWNDNQTQPMHNPKVLRSGSARLVCKGRETRDGKS